MTFRRHRITLLSLAFVVSLSGQACLFEQVAAAVAELMPHPHTDEDSPEHHRPAPFHTHDHKGHEGEYCCDNFLAQFINDESSQRDLLGESSASQYVVIGEPMASAVPAELSLFRKLRQPTSSRLRDQYALSCLLHAPPNS